MCGIVGYVGYEKAKDILLNGLSQLEYRGYDSSGIAVFEKNKIITIKATGKLENLQKKINNSDELAGTVGIGHTRWATHGKPTLSNAHPHLSENFTLVHNGIIENEEFLKEKYLKDETFNSETDSEVVVKLMEKFYSENRDIKLTFIKLIKELKGSYALAIISKDNSNTIYALKNKSPLLIGKGTDFNMLASDASAMIEKTNEFYELEDKEFAVVMQNSIQIFSQNGEELGKKPYVSHLEKSDIQKGTYPHYMLKEIEEQSNVIRRILKKYQENNFDPDMINSINECDRIYILACGTSYHAGLLGKYFFEHISNKPSEVLIASEFLYNPPLLSEKPMFIFISQSGETADCKNALTKIKEWGHKTLTITNTQNSALSRESDYTLLLWAGQEIAVASTKAYIAQITLLAILSAEIKNSINIDLKSELLRTANEMEKLFKNKKIYEEICKKYLHKSKNCFYIGRSIDYYTCLEASLKLKEISYIHTEGFAAGELKHGTIALIENNTPVIAIITQNNINSSVRGNIKEVQSRGAKVITICSNALKSSDDTIIINDVHPVLAPMLSIVPCQYLAYYCALLNGCDIDKPRNLAKSVTVE